MNLNNLNLGDQSWKYLISSNASNLEILSKSVNEDHAPLLAYVALNHKVDFQKSEALSLLLIASPPLALEVYRKIIELEYACSVKLEAMTRLTELISMEVPGSFENFVKLYGKFIRNSDRQVILADLVVNATQRYRESYDVLINIMSFLASLLAQGPESDAIYIINSIKEGYIPIEYEDVQEILMGGVAEAAQRPEKKLAKIAIQLLGIFVLT